MGKNLKGKKGAITSEEIRGRYETKRRQYFEKWNKFITNIS